MTLYEMTDEYTDLYARLAMAADDAEANEIMTEMDALTVDITGKAEGYARVMRNYEAEAEAYKAEAQRLQKRQKAAENAAQRVKARLLDAMLRLNVKSLPTSIGTWRTAMNPASCTVLDDEAVPEEWHIPQPDKIDRAGILKHYKETGELLPGVEITQSAGIRFR